MGYYTKVDCRIEFKKDTPDNIISFFKKVGELGPSEVNPLEFELGHSFFACHRWDWILSTHNNDLFSHDGHHWVLSIKAKLKMHDNDIFHLVNLLHPYILGRKQKQYLGFCQGESRSDRYNVYVDRLTPLSEQTSQLVKSLDSERLPAVSEEPADQGRKAFFNNLGYQHN